MKKAFLLLATTIALTGMVAKAQSEQWKQYMNISEQFPASMTPCEKKEFFARIDSLFDGQFPSHQAEISYMENAIKCGDTATFKKVAFRVVKWKGWNPYVFEYVDTYKFLKECDFWPELDSIQQKVHGNKKNYEYAEILYQMEKTDQEIRHALLDTNLTQEQKQIVSQKMGEIDSVNLQRLLGLIDTFGFPTWERVYSYGNNAAWILMQHSPLPYLYEFTKEYRKAVADTNADIKNLAYMEDRCRVFRGLPQLYGTQLNASSDNENILWYDPIADIKNINNRREKMLMVIMPFSEGPSPYNDKDTIITVDEDYIRNYYTGQNGTLSCSEEQRGIIDAVSLMAEEDYCTAINIFCSIFQNHYPLIRDLERYLQCLLRSECTGNEYCFVNTYEVMERMVLCGYEPDEFLSTLPDSLSTPLRADYTQLRDEYLTYLNHEDNAELSQALTSRDAFETLLRSGKWYHSYELDAWNHAYPALEKMTEELTKADYQDFFTLLWREVVRGNIHAEDYASLYDHTYFRLYGKDYYGTLAQSDKKIRTVKPRQLDQRRKSICLPSSKIGKNISSSKQ